MRFGYFLAPYHDPRRNPTAAFERDLDLGLLCDRLEFDELWVGEHAWSPKPVSPTSCNFRSEWSRNQAAA